MSKFKVWIAAQRRVCEAALLTASTVLLQAMKEDPPPDAKCRDKFLVQSVAVTADREFSNVAQIVCSTSLVTMMRPTNTV